MRSYIQWIVRFRHLVLAGTLIFTALLMAQLRSLTVIIDPDATLPQNHPYILTGNLIEKVFGNKFTLVIGITAKSGDIFQPAILEKVQRITKRLQESPLVVKSNITSISAPKSKRITGTEEGMIVAPLMPKIPTTPEEIEAMRAGLASNPVYEGLLISQNGRTTQIIAEIKKPTQGFREITTMAEAAIGPERDESVDIALGGITVFLSLLERFSARMAFLFPLALLIIGLIHYEAFRTLQALFLPLVTALLAVAWALGFLGLVREPFDVFNSSTPILILAIAAGHAVQILKRYYEEYAQLSAKDSTLVGRAKSEQAVINSLTKVGPVMIVACAVAAMGFFSLMIFEIKSVRTFGLFTGVGVLSALILEMTFIPALRVLLPPPGQREIERESAKSFWDRLVGKFFDLAMNHRKRVYGVFGALIVLFSLGGHWLKINNSQKSFFYGSIPARLDDDHLNAEMAGTNPFYFLVEGAQEDAIKRPDVLRAMEGMSNFIAKQETVGKTMSLVDFIKRMNQAMNGDNKEFYVLPDSQDLIAQYLLLYSNSGDPGDFDSYVDYGYQRALVTAFTRSDSSVSMQRIADETLAFAKSTFPPDVKVTVGGGTLGGVALNEIMIHEKVLNILQIMAAVFLIASLVFRSFMAGLLILVPLVAAVFVNFGIMGLLGIPLQIATALVSAMAVGIGADYGIYMSYRLREELRTDPDERRAIERAFRSAGKATLFVSTAVAGGFGVLMLSYGFMIHVWMGFLIGTAMLVSSTTALTLFPALVFSIRPKFIFEQKR